MKKIVFHIIILFVSHTSMAQRIKSFDCIKEREDSVLITYSLKVTFDSRGDKEKCIELVKAELKTIHQIERDKIISIESFNDKRYLTYRYRLKVKKE